MEIFDFVLIFFGYWVGYYLALPISWFLIFMTLIHYLSRLLMSNDHFPTRSRMRKRNNSLKRIKSHQLLEDSLEEIKKESGGLILNSIFQRVWNKFDSKIIIEYLNEAISEESKTKLIEKIQFTKINFGKISPKINSIKSIDSTENHTTLEIEFEYEGDSSIEWILRPRVVPLDLRCEAKDIYIFLTLRISIEYSEFGIKELNISLSDFPEIDYNILIFESFDFKSITNSIPLLNSSIQKKFKEYLQTLIYPNTFPLIQKRGSLHLPTNLLNEFDQDSILELEDEIKNSILNVNDLLSKKLSLGINKETAKKEIFISILQFLKFGEQPNKIPVSMIETVQRAFQILNNLMFDEKGQICQSIFNLLLEKDNISFIGYVIRTCSFADCILSSIMKIQDEKLKSKVNQVFNDYDLQDLPLIVINRINK